MPGTGARAFLLVVGLAAVVAAAVTAGGFDPALRPTVSGMSATHHALVTGSELGSAWTPGSAFTPSTTAIPCTNLEPNESGLVETGVGGTSFDHGPWRNVTAAVRVFATAAQAEDSWRETNRPALLRCYERSLEGEGGRLVGATRFTFSSAAQHSAGFRLVTATSQRPLLGKGPSLLVRTYTDVFVLSNGRTQELVAFSSLTSPLSREFEARTVRRVGERMFGAPRA
jgi:hypothetical protein